MSIDITNDILITLELSTRSEENIRLKTRTNINSFINLVEKYYKNLAAFLNLAPITEKSNYGATAKSLNFLDQIGQQFLYELLHEQERQQLRQFFLKTVPLRQNALTNNYIPPFIEVRSQTDVTIPFESLPVFGSYSEIDIFGDEELFRSASRFLGFSAIVTREIYSPDKKSTFSLCNGTLENDSGLRVRFYKNEGLKSVLDEEKYLTSEKNIEFLDDWPGDVTDKDTLLQKFAKQIFEGGERLWESDLDHIQHLACHAETNSAKSENYFISLTYKTTFLTIKQTKTINISISDLIQQFSVKPEKNLKLTYPLIFLNACGSSKNITSLVSSFPKLFQNNLNRGFIGTETPIPDIIATIFSRNFYAYTLQGQPLGSAIYMSRRDLLKHNKNPLGLLYTIYANPDLRVKRPSA